VQRKRSKGLTRNVNIVEVQAAWCVGISHSISRHLMANVYVDKSMSILATFSLTLLSIYFNSVQFHLKTKLFDRLFNVNLISTVFLTIKL